MKVSWLGACAVLSPFPNILLGSAHHLSSHRVQNLILLQREIHLSSFSLVIQMTFLSLSQANVPEFHIPVILPSACVPGIQSWTAVLLHVSVSCPAFSITIFPFFSLATAHYNAVWKIN